MAKQVNQAETVRKAVNLYKSNIETDTLVGLGVLFKKVLLRLDEVEARTTETYEMVEEIKNIIEEVKHS